MGRRDTEAEPREGTGFTREDLSILRAGLFQTGVLKQGSRADKLLLYLVTDEIEGKGERYGLRTGRSCAPMTACVRVDHDMPVFGPSHGEGRRRGLSL